MADPRLKVLVPVLDTTPYRETLAAVLEFVSRWTITRGQLRLVDEPHPRALPIDGQAYHRRRRARRRRARR
ncbi:hypothetical protein QWY28_17475 [Nocardioides sp. SOB77]|uniref:Uncharacterized protein n=1 Tax=Nocardioides oceani TaxID=3058369 RepID=A0ABT8FJA3_9ACTN|nr:hypothetical protein [Nocardioides oceani]MDN4174756.1 hypothetical protein [Nocardioides oceani]